MPSIDDNDGVPVLSEAEQQMLDKFESMQIDVYAILMRLRPDLRALFDGQDSIPQNRPADKILLPIDLDKLTPGPNNEQTEPYYEIIPRIAVIVEQTREVTMGVEIANERCVRETSYLNAEFALRIFKQLQPDNFRNYLEYYLLNAKELRGGAVLAERNNRDYATVAADQQMIEDAAARGYKNLSGDDLEIEWPTYG